VPAYGHRRQHHLHTVRFGSRHCYQHHLLRETHPHQSRAAIATRRKKRPLRVGGLVVFVVVVVFLGLSAYHSALWAKTSLGAARTVISSDPSVRQAFLSSAGRAKLASDVKTGGSGCRQCVGDPPGISRNEGGFGMSRISMINQMAL
jgi:hypothetical protein